MGQFRVDCAGQELRVDPLQPMRFSLKFVELEARVPNAADRGWFVMDVDVSESSGGLPPPTERAKAMDVPWSGKLEWWFSAHDQNSIYHFEDDEDNA